jgi:hypothetical protein
MTAKRLSCLLLAALLCSSVPVGAAQIRKDPARDILLQTIGMLAGQGLVLGHESLDGIFVRFENKLLPREKAEQILADETRYASLVMGVFKGRLMGQLDEQEKKDLLLLIGFYEAQREAIAALTTYVHDGGGKNRESFEKSQERVAAITRQISLGATTP